MIFWNLITCSVLLGSVTCEILRDSEFVHIGITPKAASNKTVWGGPVTDKEYAEAAGGK